MTVPTERVSLPGTLVVTRLMDGGDLATDESPLVLDHPAVSRRHARLGRYGSTVVLEDLGSTNGTFLNRQRLRAPQALASNDVIEIGPFRLLFDGTELVRLSRANHAALRVTTVAQDVLRAGARGNAPTHERILHELTLRIQPGRVTCVIGASGSGKSTLLNIMAGRVTPSQGTVALGTLDLHQHFQALKHDIAFLPQTETIHAWLTVRQALKYAAQLRLPRATLAAVRNAAIEDAVVSVGLEHRLDTPIRLLSGGQRKRSCLAAEILAKPSLLFLDEATSGLDEVTDRETMSLLKRLSREGMSIVCVTHTLSNLYDNCDDLVVLAAGGHLVFQGTPAAALRTYQVDNLGDMLAEIERLGPAGVPQPPAARPPIEHTPSAPGAPPAVHTPAATQRLTLADRWHQWLVLVHRNVSLLVADRRALVMALLQSALIGWLIGWVFGDFGSPPARAAAQKACLLLLGITALWMGCSSASKDIVGDLPVFVRERDMNLSPLSFVLAKGTVTTSFVMLQVAVMLVLTTLAVEQVPGGAWAQGLVLLLSGGCGVAMGLLISSLCKTRDQANIIVPLAVAPQLILGSGLAPNSPDVAQWVANVGISVQLIRLQLEHTAGIASAAIDVPHAWYVPVLVLQIILLVLFAWGITCRVGNR